MTAVDMKASGTFTCGSTYKAELNSTGQLAGYRGTSKVGYIDYSSSTYNKDNPSEIWYGMQMQAQGIVRITTPRISTAQTSNTSVTTKQGSTRNFRQNIVTEVRDNGNGTIGWSYGTFELDFINGILKDGFAAEDRTLLLCCEEGRRSTTPNPCSTSSPTPWTTPPS